MQIERREMIRELLGTKPFISLDELGRMFPDVSEMTLRRDIDYFEETGEAIKVRGGCRSVGFITAKPDDRVSERLKENVGVKRAIAKAATEFLETGRSIFVDSGSTMRNFVEHVPGKRFSFTTTDPAVALELCKDGMSAVNMVGGRLEADNQTVTGLQATRFLSDINIDVAFLAPSGYSEEGGFSVANFNECELKRIVVDKAKVVVMLIDSSKFGKSLPYTFCTAEHVDVIVTDSGIPEQIAKHASLCGTKIVIADAPADAEK